MLDLNKQLKSAEQNDREDDLFGSAEDFPAAEEREEFAAEDIPEAEAQDPAEETVPAVDLPRSGRRRRRNIDDEEMDKYEVSRILEEARCRMGLSPQDVEEITKIRAGYITALEKGVYDDLPQSVYVLAYLRRLSELYGLSKDDEEAVIAPWSELQFETPDNYPAAVYSDESGDNRKVIRKLEIAIFSLIALAVIGLVVFGVILLVSFIRGNIIDRSVAFDDAEIVKLQPVQKLKISEPLPRGR
jgi:hypothetical protein